MKDKKLYKYTFEMSKLEFTNSLEMYINSSGNKIFMFHKLINLKLNTYYFDLFEMKDRDKYIGQFDFEDDTKLVKITGRYIVKENWITSSIQPFFYKLFFTVLVPIALIMEILKNVNSKTLSIIILTLTLAYLILVPYKIFKFFSKRKKKGKAEKLEAFQKDIEIIFRNIINERQK